MSIGYKKAGLRNGIENADAQSEARRFPASGRPVELPSDGYKIVDANCKAVAYVYGRYTRAGAAIASSLTLDEARRIAANIAKLPDLLK